jgi:ribosomal protein S6
MRLYDLVLVMRSSLKDADQKKLLDTVKGWLKDVKVVKEDAWGQKPLAYTIKKEVAGVYHRFQLETEKTIPSDFEQRLLQNEHVLRHLLLRKK